MQTTTFTPELSLEQNDRALLASTIAMPGFKIIERLMKSEADKFVVDMLNCPVEDKDKVYAKFILAKAAAQYFSGIARTVNEEVMQYTQGPLPNQAPVDNTEGILDLGATAADLYQQGQDIFLEEGRS